MPAANPLLTKPQADFFGAVAGKGLPHFAESSRIARPFATNPVLGGMGATVSTPVQQATLAALTLGQTPSQRLAKTVAADTTPTLAHVALPRTNAAAAIIAGGAPVGGKTQQAHARAVEAAIAGPADRVVQTTTRTGPGIGSGLTIEATAPQIVSYASKLHSIGIPLASLSMPLQHKIKDAFTSVVTHAPSFQYSGVKDIGWFSPADKAKIGLGADATDADYLRKVYAPFLGHSSYVGGLLANIPRNTLELAAAPAGLAQLAGHDLGAGLVRGDWQPAKTDVTELGREQVQFGKDAYNDPLGTLKKNPVTVATSLIGIGRLAGAGAGLAARSAALEAGAGALGQGERAAAIKAFATPSKRSIVPAGLGDVRDVHGNPIAPPPIGRGLTSKNLYDRIGESASDWLAQHVAVAGKRADRQSAAALAKDQMRLKNEAAREHVEPAVKAAQKLNRAELRAVTFAHGQGVKPSEMASYFTEQASKHRTLEQDAKGSSMSGADEHGVWRATQGDLDTNAKLWTKIHAKVGDDLTPEMQDALAKATHASREAEVQMSAQSMPGSSEPLISDESMLRRAYIPMARVKAAAGDAGAQEFLDLDRERQILQERIQHAGNSDAQARSMEREIDSIRNQQALMLAKQKTQIERQLATAKGLKLPKAGSAADLEAERAIGQLKVQHAKASAQLDQTARELAAAKGLRAPARRGAFAGSVHDLMGQRAIAQSDVAGIERAMAKETKPAPLKALAARHDAAEAKVADVQTRIEQARAEDTAMRQQGSEPTIAPGQRPLMMRSPGEIHALEQRHAALTQHVSHLEDQVANVRSDAAGLRAMKAEQAISPGQPVRTVGSAAKIAQLETRRAALEDAHAAALGGESTSARIGQLQTRLAETPTLQRLLDSHGQVTREAGESLARLRNAHRLSLPTPASAIAPNAPLDLSDPLYHPHVANTSAGLRRTLGGNGIGILSKNPRPRYGARLGFGGEQFNGNLFATGRASSDPVHFFGAAAKPNAVAAALRHLQAQVSAHAIKVTGGETYDPEAHVLLNLGKSGAEHDVTKGARTTSDVDQASRDLDDNQWRHQLLSHFKDQGGARATVALRNSTRQVVPKDGDDYVLVSRGAYEHLKNEFQSGKLYDSKLFRGLQRSTKVWRWATLLARPAWLVNNVAGNAVQATLAGAGLTSWLRALRTGEGSAFEGTIPARAQNNGLFREVFGDTNTHPLKAPIRAVTKLTDLSVRANIAYENLARRAVYLSKALPAAKRGAFEDERAQILNGFRRTNADVIENLKRMAVDEQAAPNIVESVYRWLGDFSRAKQTPGLDFISPFHQWFVYVTKLTATMPLKTPGRALLLQRLGEFGVNVMANQTGGFTPNSLQGAFRLPQRLPLVGGLYKTTQGLNPLATDFQLVDPNDQSTLNPGYPGAQGILGAANPFVGALSNFATGTDFETQRQLKDQYGDPAGNFNPAVLGNQFENAIPLASTIAGYSHVADTSLNPLSPQRIAATAGQQPTSNGLVRGLGYVGFTAKPFDPVLNQVVDYKRLKSSLRTSVHNRAKHKP